MKLKDAYSLEESTLAGRKQLKTLGFGWKWEWLPKGMEFLFPFFGWHSTHDIQDLSSPTRDGTCTCIVEGQSLPHWTSREAPGQRSIPRRHWFGKCSQKYGSRKRKTEKNEKVISKCTNKVTPWSYIMSPRFPCYCRKGWNTYAMVPISLWMVMSLDY